MRQRDGSGRSGEGNALMDSQLLQFGGSLVAISALVVLAHFLGFSRTARLEDPAEARALFRLAPGGFEPVEIALDIDGHGAIARDGAGRLAVLIPHGQQFVARTLGPAARLRRDGETLLVEDAALGTRVFALQLGEAAHIWATTDTPAI